MIFSQRNTVEFRIHSPTTNGQRMVNWLFICNAILRYAQHNAKHIITTDKPITLADVLNYYTTYFPENPNSKFLVDYLNAYIDERKKAFEKDYKNGDVISKWEMTGDKDYVFTYKGVSKLF